MTDTLTNRLRGIYEVGPQSPNGLPEFGIRQFESPLIQKEAAEEIERLSAIILEMKAFMLSILACVEPGDDSPEECFAAIPLELVDEFCSFIQRIRLEGRA
jgi:hypothetical protein